MSYEYPPPPEYPSRTIQLTPEERPRVNILSSPGKGRGVYAAEKLKRGRVVEIAPVLVLTKDEYYGKGDGVVLKGVEASMLRGYVFTWDGTKNMALALGMGSLFNHSSSPNLSYTLNKDQYTISYCTTRDVDEDEELCIYYGPEARFEGDAREEDNQDENDEWGGLLSKDDDDEDDDDEGSGLLEVEEGGSDRQQAGVPVLEKDPSRIVELSELDFEKISNQVDPEDEELTTFDCYGVVIPAKHTQKVFGFTRKFHTSSNDPLGHLKRAKEYHVEGQEKHLTVLLGPVDGFPTIPELEEEIKTCEWGTSCVHTPEGDIIRVIPVPANAAYTSKQHEEWSQVWPVSLVHIREGERGRYRVRGWNEGKIEWVNGLIDRLLQEATKAKDEGELPIVSMLVHTPEADQTKDFGKPLLITHDTRNSTRNTFSHSCFNLIDQVALMDLSENLVDSFRTRSDYLLTGYTVVTTHEPCIMCSMALLHSRIKEVLYVLPTPGSGGLGSVEMVQEAEGLNHKFTVWQAKSHVRTKLESIDNLCVDS